MDLRQRPQSLKYFLPGPLEKGFLGIPWWSSGYDSSLSPLRAPVQSLIRELRSHKQPQHRPPPKKERVSYWAPGWYLGAAWALPIISFYPALPNASPEWPHKLTLPEIDREAPPSSHPLLPKVCHPDACELVSHCYFMFGSLNMYHLFIQQTSIKGSLWAWYYQDKAAPFDKRKN